MIFAFNMRRNVDPLCTSFCSPWRVRMCQPDVPVNKGLLSSDRKVVWLVLFSMPFNQHSGAIYLKTMSYLVVKISSDIVTEHYCQVCVLPMMFCRSEPGCVLTWWVIAQSGTWEPRVLISLRQANVGHDVKNGIPIWFLHYTLTDTSVL